ncbi:variable large family protein [Borrelia sp. HM]|uniref:variable large family protein n=1 Tax=Borrelia sp. HM TaxID=1882662 RepID=UPI001C753515|nr:variable large family protein [Borrelia sp. HM]BCR21450.1 Variable large protein 7 [Borrelia sp. HM]
MRRRGIIIGGMVIGLLMGCNNGGEDPQKVFLKSVVSLGNEFLNVFTSFGEMVGDVLGFNAETKKSQVGEYFKKVKKTVEGTRDKLNTMVENMRKEGNPNAEATDGAVKILNGKLEEIIKGANTVSEAIGDADAKDLIGNVADTGTKAGAKGDVENLINGMKGIVDVVLKNEGNAGDGDTNKASSGTGPRTANDAGILFANNNAGSNEKTAATDAAKAVGAVSGIAAILQAIAKGESGEAATLAKHNAGNGSSGDGKKDAVIAGGIALRAMAKNGKFANGSSQDISAAVKGVAVSAVTKALNALTIAIRKTIDDELKKVKEAMKINPETTPVAVEAGHAAK